MSIADEARDDLHWIASRWYDLRARLIPTSSGGDGVRTAPSSRPPIDLHVSDLLYEIREWARFHAHVLLDETHDYTPSDGMPGLLYDVADRYGHFVTTDDPRNSTDAKTALEFCDWAHEYRRKVERTLTKPPNPRYMGDCPNGTCEGDLYLKPGRESMICRECGVETGLLEQREFIRKQLESRLMTVSELTSALVVVGNPVPFRTVQSWAHRRRMQEHDGGLYRLAEALDLAEARKVRV